MNWKELQRTGQFGTPWLVNLLLKKKTQEQEEEEEEEEEEEILKKYLNAYAYVDC